MPFFKSTLVFESTAGYGWSESYWQSLYTNQTLQDAIANTRRLAINRALMLSNTIWISYLRTSQYGVSPRASWIENTDTLPSGRYYGSLRDTADMLDVAIILRGGNAAGTRQKNIFSRGQPDSCVNNAGEYTPTAGFTRALNQFISEVVRVNTPWGWFGASNPQVGTIGNIVTNPQTGLVTFTVAPAIDLGNGSITPARVKDVQGARTLNGPVVLRQLAPGSFQSIKGIASLAWTGGGSIRFNGNSFNTFQSLRVNRVGERKVGAPLYHSRGRQRPRVRA